jgi:hypothetical protein
MFCTERRWDRQSLVFIKTLYSCKLSTCLKVITTTHFNFFNLSFVIKTLNILFVV